MPNVLLVDDDVELCALLTEYLHDSDFQVSSAHDGKQALAKLASDGVDIVVLDVMLPVMNGFEVLRELRKTRQTPVLMLTARGEDIDSILGLELGADDYLSKPCNPRVLAARIRAVLRRSEPRQSDDLINPYEIAIGDIKIHTGSRHVEKLGSPIILTSTEFSILEVLMRSAGHVISKNDLCERALGRPLGRFDRSLDMHISNLRQKLGPLDNANERIKTVRRNGYQYIVY